MNETRLLYSRKEASRMLGISLAALDKQIKNKLLPVVKIGDRPMLAMEDLHDFVKNQKKVGH